jgi:hypothetical protein
MYVKEMEVEDFDWIYLAQDEAYWPVSFVHLNEVLSSATSGQFFLFCKTKYSRFQEVPCSMELFHV